MPGSPPTRRGRRRRCRPGCGNPTTSPWRGDMFGLNHLASAVRGASWLVRKGGLRDRLEDLERRAELLTRLEQGLERQEALLGQLDRRLERLGSQVASIQDV